MTEPLLRVEELSVEYLTATGPVRVLDGVSFVVGRGEVFGLAGESGSGKTTVALAILRLLKAPAAITGGRVWFDGQELTALGDPAMRGVRGRRISLVTQSALDALNPVMPVGAQLGDAISAHHRVRARDRDARVAELLAGVGIDPGRARSYPHELSGGMRQRVVIAMALAQRPPLILMDEPTTALDVIVQRELLTEIARLQAELGFSILFITHDLALMLELCTHIGVLYAGRLAEVAPAQVIGARARHPYTQGLLGCFPDPRAPSLRLAGIPGAPPDPRHPPAGCRFHPRCDRRLPACSAEPPAPRVIAPGHEASCWLP